MERTTRRLGGSIDMLTGPLLKKLLLFGLPLMASSMLQLLFNAADVVVLGRYANYASLAAVGSTTAIVNLMINLLIGISIGVNVLDRGLFEDQLHIIWNHILNGTVTGTYNIAFCNDIPEGNSVII